MNRRSFLKCAANSGIALSCLPWIANAQTSVHNGELLLVISANGGWDTSLYIDPKVNISGELPITNWSRDGSIQKAGNIAYAPIINNESFFKKFADRTLVINGVDTQTNSHSTGANHTFSGRNSEGFPSLPAIFAATHAPNIPFATLNLGGFSKTANIIAGVNLRQGRALRSVVNKDNVMPDGSKLRQDFETNLILKAQQESFAYLNTQKTSLLPKYMRAIEQFNTAQKLSPGLEPFLDILPNDNNYQPSVGLGSGSSDALTNAQLILLSFKAGVTASASMAAGGFYDSHQDNDNSQYMLLEHLNDTLEYIWDYSEELGIANRLTVLVSSDFCRTPHYNTQNGKDHWPTNSYMVMRKNAPWANQVIGETDEIQNAKRINPNSLAIEDSASSIIMSPGHIHKALRHELGISGSHYDTQFNFHRLEDVALFTKV